MPTTSTTRQTGGPQTKVPETCHSATVLGAPLAPVALRSLADDTDGSDDCDGMGEISSAIHLGKVVPILAGHKANQAHPPTSGTPIESQRTVSRKSGAAAKAKYTPNSLGANGKERDSDRLIRLAEPAFLFHSHDREAFATSKSMAAWTPGRSRAPTSSIGSPTSSSWTRPVPLRPTP